MIGAVSAALNDAAKDEIPNAAAARADAQKAGPQKVAAPKGNDQNGVPTAENMIATGAPATSNALNVSVQQSVSAQRNVNAQAIGNAAKAREAIAGAATTATPIGTDVATTHEIPARTRVRLIVKGAGTGAAMRDVQIGAMTDVPTIAAIVIAAAMTIAIAAMRAAIMVHAASAPIAMVTAPAAATAITARCTGFSTTMWGSTQLAGVALIIAPMRRPMAVTLWSAAIAAADAGSLSGR
jgi:hypothetical protein